MGGRAFDQIYNMSSNTKVLIFRKNINEPIDIVEFKDIENKYRCRVYFKINMKVAKQLVQKMNNDLDNTLQRLIMLDR